MTTLVYTCLTARRDELPVQAVKPPGFDFVCFSDEPERYAYRGWTVLPLHKTMETSTLTCRYHKLHPRNHSPGYSRYLWVDSHISVRLRVKELIHAAGDVDLSVFKHRTRNDPYQEVEAVRRARLASAENCHLARRLLSIENYPHEGGLHETGIMLSRGTARVARMMQDWWLSLLQSGTARDQFHFDRVVRKHGLKLFEPEGTVRVNPYFNWNCHAHPASGETVRRQKQWNGLIALEKS